MPLIKGTKVINTDPQSHQVKYLQGKPLKKFPSELDYRASLKKVNSSSLFD